MAPNTTRDSYMAAVTALATNYLHNIRCRSFHFFLSLEKANTHTDTHTQRDTEH